MPPVITLLKLYKKLFRDQIKANRGSLAQAGRSAALGLNIELLTKRCSAALTFTPSADEKSKLALPSVDFCHACTSAAVTPSSSRYLIDLVSPDLALIAWFFKKFKPV